MENTSIINIQGEDVDIDSNDIVKAIKKLKNGKSFDPEGIYTELLKSKTTSFFDTFTMIFNKCLNNQEPQTQWKEVHIISIDKKGSKENCQNYRGITIISTMSRLYGKILRDLIEKKYNEEEQSRFHAGKSCNDNIFCVK